MRQHVHGGNKGWRVVSCLGFAVALLSVVSPPAQAQSTCTEWSPWERVSNQLDFSFRVCEQTRNRVEILWKWSNLSPDDLTFSYWIHLRDPAGCLDRVRGTAGVSLAYVEIPVLATLVLPTGAPRRIASTIFAGPAIAVEVGCNVETEIVGEAGSRSCDEGGVSTKSVDAGLRVGGGLMFQTRPASFLVEVAYTLGLINIDDFPDSTDEVKNRNLSFSVGIMFPINIGRARDF